ncbi:hypothetical protein BLNAU_4724 [Blattamonas nauphoetae]|uniref:Uncharacterized protein n=1 Tax=Blattamonas nauphoetae TaxID=2049346 RepID=A0ABQ9Y8Z1_9EUKA|nr:hypothetical protein BLNAU_4724 [Blattamonas nauphoetae]
MDTRDQSIGFVGLPSDSLLVVSHLARSPFERVLLIALEHLQTHPSHSLSSSRDTPARFHSWPFSIPAPSPPTPSHSPLPLPHLPPLPSHTPPLCSLPHHPHLPLPSASPSPPTPSHSLCLSLTTHTLPLSSASPSPPTPPTPLCLSLPTHTLPLRSASPSPPTHSHFPLPLHHHPHPPTPLCLSLTTHTLPLPSASPSPTTPSHSLCLSLTTHTLPLPLPLPHQPHPPTPVCLSSPPTPSHSPLPLPHHPHTPTSLCLSLTNHTLPLPSASPSPPTPSDSPLPLHHHPHPPTPSASPSPPTPPTPSASPSPPTPSLSPLPLPHHPHPPTPSASLPTHTLPLPCACPSPPTPSLSLCLSLPTHTLPLPLPLPPHPHPPTPVCLSLTTHTLRLPSASPSPPTPSHSPLPLPHHPHPPTPLCLSLTIHTLPLPSASPLTTLAVACAAHRSFKVHPPTPAYSFLPMPDTETESDDSERDEKRCLAEAGRGRAVWGKCCVWCFDSAETSASVVGLVLWDGDTVVMDDGVGQLKPQMPFDQMQTHSRSQSQVALHFHFESRSSHLTASSHAQPRTDLDSITLFAAKAVKCLESVDPLSQRAADAFLTRLASSCDESLTNFIQSIVVLISCTSQTITTATMKMLDSLILFCSIKLRLALVKANLIPQIINTLNPLSLSFAETVDIHISLMEIIHLTLRLATPHSLARLGLKDGDEQQAVHETVLQQVLAPSEKYIWDLCVNRYSIIDGELSTYFLDVIAQLLQISSYYRPTMEIVLHMPIFLAIPSSFTFIEDEHSIGSLLNEMNSVQRECNSRRGEMRQIWKTMDRMLRMEGGEDVMEQKLQINKNGFYGRRNVDQSIEWNNLQGMNIQKRW